MLRYQGILSVLIFFTVFNYSFAQKDSTHHKKIRIDLSSDSSLAFTGTRITDKTDTVEKHHIIIGGYVSAYYAHYSDEGGAGGFVQFPTVAPRADQFGLNMALISMQYRSKRLRSNISLHYGDIPESTWPKTFNLIQEAHAGVQLVKHLWLDAGFFKSHIGLESIQPRENITTSMSLIDYHEPYFLSGVKLTYGFGKLSLQLNMFNGFNEYVEDNKNKAFGFSAIYEFNDNVSITYNFITCDETLDSVVNKHQRYYHNLYATFKFKRISLGLEGNYAQQERSLKSDSAKTADMFSGQIVAKLQVLKKFAVYGRGEYFSDSNQILTGTINSGNYIMGSTFGLEYKPARNMAFRTEGRLLQCDNLLFREGAYRTNQRYEIIGCLDLWF
jgi:hypothetical protein